MNFRDKILDYYKILLSIGWLEADEDGFVSLVVGDEKRPATIDGKRVFLPTREQMKNKDWATRIGFHPLRESYNLGISDTLANLRDQYVQRLNVAIAYLMKELIAIAYDQKNQKNLTTEQAQVLNALPNVGDTTVRQFEDLQKKTRARNDADQFINIFIRKGGMVRGQTFGRAAIISFPLYDKLKEGDDKINGVKFSAKDRAMLVKLFEFIFPTITDKEAFNVGVNAKTAPFLEALIRSTFLVVDQLVETSAPYMDLVALPSILQFPEDMGDWIEIFDSKDTAEKLAMSIPNLTRGDEGIEEIVEQEDRPVRSEATRKEPAVKKEDAPAAQAEARPRGRMILGASVTHPGEGLGKSKPDQNATRAGSSDRAIPTGRSVSRDSDLDRETELRQREEADRVRRQREREEREDRAEREERRRQRDEDDRRRDRGYDRDDDRRRDERDRDSHYSRDRDYDRDDRGRERRSGDIFEDNPILRGNLRDEEDRHRRSRYDDTRDGRRVRDMRDRYRGGRDEYDRDYDRGYDRDRRYRR